jgi:hypothetical protein
MELGNSDLLSSNCLAARSAMHLLLAFILNHPDEHSVNQADVAASLTNFGHGGCI